MLGPNLITRIPAQSGGWLLDTTHQRGYDFLMSVTPDSGQGRAPYPEPAKLPNIGTVVRAKVSLPRCPEGTIGYIKEVFSQVNGPAVVIQISSREIFVSASDYSYFFEVRSAS